MNAKQNALEIIRFGRPERVMTGAPCHVISYLGCNHENFEGRGHDQPVGTRWTDVWGTVWQKEQEGIMGFPQVHPLDEPSKLRAYQWPRGDDERIVGRICEQAKGWNAEEKFLAGSHRETLWEKCYMLVGMENMMVYFRSEPNYAREICQRVMDWDLTVAGHYLKLGIELANCGDDLGTQLGPLLGPEIFGEFLRPQYRRLFDLYKSRGVIINFHSCGKIDTVVEPLMDLGVHILNPVQATANDLDQLRARTQGRMCLSGGVSSATVHRGPVAAIEAEARQRMWQLGRQGGYFCGADQGLPFPKEHTDALSRAVEKYGQYPLQAPA